MSNLNELLEKLSGADQPPKVSSEDSAEVVYLDPVFIEKLASAVEYLADGFDTTLTKEANIAKVKANLAQGMGMKEAVKAAYPGWNDDQVKAFIAEHGASLGGGAKEAPAEAPKEEGAPKGEEGAKALLAKKMLDKMKGKEASADSGDGVVNKLRSALKEKVASQVEEKQEEENSFIDSIMAKIEALNSEAEKTAEESEPEETEAEEATTEESEESTDTEETEEVEESSAEVSEEDEQVSKEASEDSDNEAAPRLSLADMLKNVNLESTEKAVESVPSGSVKTAVDQGSIISSKLKNSLLNKVRTEV